MKTFTRFSMAGAGLIALLLLVPGTAAAKGSVHIDIPGLSIGVHDDHYRHHRKHYRGDRHHKKRHYRKRHRQSYYYDPYYYDPYYSNQYDYRSGRRDYRSRYAPRCPTAGFSEYYLRNRDCYRHKDHFHCGN